MKGAVRVGHRRLSATRSPTWDAIARAQYLDANQYVGPAPVPLAAYVDAMRALARGARLHRARSAAVGFSHLVVADEVLEQLGPAVNAGKAVFLYGPPGNGKTVIAEGHGRALGGDIYVPYAIDVDGQTVTVSTRSTTSRSSRRTSRAISSVIAPCAARSALGPHPRPVVIVGGELTLDMLDLTFNPISKFHEAPLQLKANGGVFLVDDFGRQRMRPRGPAEPLDRPAREPRRLPDAAHRQEIPGAVRRPDRLRDQPRSASLADEAFLRRIPYKIPIEDPSLERVHADLRAELPRAASCAFTR